MRPFRTDHAPLRRTRRAPRPRLASLSVVVTAVATIALVPGCGASSADRSAATASTTTTTNASSAYGSGWTANPTAATDAVHTATRAFNAQIVASTAAFVDAVDRLQSDAAAGDTAAARSDELAAQAGYDGIRVLETGNAVNGATLDELSTDAAPDTSFGGLHAVERDLWVGGPLAADVASLAGQAPVAQFLLGRVRLGPEAVGQVAVDQLNWVGDVALPVGQERFSHLGLVDVAATEQAAHRSFDDVEPLAALVAPGQTATVSAQFAALDADVAALGDPTVVPDATVGPAARLAVTRQLDATAAGLARLVARLTPFGTDGAPS